MPNATALTRSRTYVNVQTAVDITEEQPAMASVTLTNLHELAGGQLEQLIGLMAHERDTTAATAPRVAAVFMALLDGLSDEQQRRQQSGLPHSAAAITVPLPTAGELSAAEMESLMRVMLRGRTGAAGGTPAAARVFDAMLAALQGTRTRQRDTLAHLDQALGDRG
jgi:hypothetical protein